jgi:hypothetical protein
VTVERDGIRIKANFNASTSKLLPDVVLIASQAKDTVAATASKTPPLLKIPRIARENRSTSGILALRVAHARSLCERCTRSHEPTVRADFWDASGRTGGARHPSVLALRAARCAGWIDDA